MDACEYVTKVSACNVGAGRVLHQRSQRRTRPEIDLSDNIRWRVGLRGRAETTRIQLHTTFARACASLHMARADWLDFKTPEAFMSKKNWIALGIAATAAMTMLAPAAHARGNASIYLNIGGGAPAYYGNGYPNYQAPAYVYSEPAYVYSQPSYVYTQPSYVYSQPSYGYSQPYYGGHRHYRPDRDHDGVPDRFDRRPNNPYRY
jgi:hypothetical protein